jgi:hypothetical protein
VVDPEHLGKSCGRAVIGSPLVWTSPAQGPSLPIDFLARGFPMTRTRSTAQVKLIEGMWERL